MDNALVHLDAENLALMQHLGGQVALPMPYGQEILLLECHIAGTAYRHLDDQADLLHVGDRLILRREAGNPHDAMAIQVWSKTEVMLGYVPRDNNEILARLMDAGKHLTATLTGNEWVDNWLKLEMSIHLQDF
jgi:hypothetical protein